MRTRTTTVAVLALAALVLACGGNATGEYARQLCAPYEQFTTALTDASGHAHGDSHTQAPAQDSHDALGQFDVLEGPLAQLARDLADVDPPGGLREYHGALVARTDYTARAVDAVVERGPFGVFGLGVTSEPSKTEMPAGLSEAVLLECGAAVAAYFGDQDILDMVGENAAEIDDHH